MPPWNAITVARACRAGLAGLALVILSASLAEADYGPRTTIGKNYQQWSNTESENRIDPAACVSTSFCTVLLQPIPQQQPLIVQHVACSVEISTGGPYLVQLGTRKGQTIVGRFTPLVAVPMTGNFWAVNSPVMHLYKSGERPFVQFLNTAPAGWAVACSISGKLK